ncbi:hypothetical protein B0H16DRAFT_1850713 [Mycena metata]|uniref:Uncharacterized protein n=1 Tax=Mycena metata TaxID=1033252 RepID=A0AAD7IR86_9AGAR|nr:hypothetical protein B0H16DRAFT_1850713 [Mycena metata]
MLPMHRPHAPLSFVACSPDAHISPARLRPHRAPLPLAPAIVQIGAHGDRIMHRRSVARRSLGATLVYMSAKARLPPPSTVVHVTIIRASLPTTLLAPSFTYARAHSSRRPIDHRPPFGARCTGKSASGERDVASCRATSARVSSAVTLPILLPYICASAFPCFFLAYVRVDAESNPTADHRPRGWPRFARIPYAGGAVGGGGAYEKKRLHFDPAETQSWGRGTCLFVMVREAEAQAVYADSHPSILSTVFFVMVREAEAEAVYADSHPSMLPPFVLVPSGWMHVP